MLSGLKSHSREKRNLLRIFVTFVIGFRLSQLDFRFSKRYDTSFLNFSKSRERILQGSPLSGDFSSARIYQNSSIFRAEAVPLCPTYLHATCQEECSFQLRKMWLCDPAADRG